MGIGFSYGYEGIYIKQCEIYSEKKPGPTWHSSEGAQISRIMTTSYQKGVRCYQRTKDSSQPIIQTHTHIPSRYPTPFPSNILNHFAFVGVGWCRGKIKDSPLKGFVHYSILNQ